VFIVGRLHVAKMPILPDVVYKFNTISIKLSTSFSVEIEKLVLKLIWNIKES
jgi:hypothetical protein